VVPGVRPVAVGTLGPVTGRRCIAPGVLVACALGWAAAPASAVVTAAVTADAHTSAQAATTNFGGATELRVGGGETAYLRFAVAGVKAPVKRAVLRLFVTSGTPSRVDVRTTGTAWSEFSINASNAPVPAGAPVAYAQSLASGRWAEIDVSSAVTGNGTYSFVLSGFGAAARIVSRERSYSERARLVLEPMTATQELDEYVSDVAGATARRYDAKSSAGVGLDALDVVQLPSGPARFLGLHHSYDQAADKFSVRAVTSEDLLTWTHARQWTQRSSQPTVAVLPGGAILVAYEQDVQDEFERTSLVFERYASATALLSGAAPTNVFAPPRTLSDYYEGTPSIRSVSLAPDLAHSTIVVDFHYFTGDFVDRQATATITNFASWSAQAAPALDAALAPFGVAGNIGDRDEVVFRGTPRTLLEGQLTQFDFGSWRLFGYDRSRQRATPLDMRTNQGSTSFGNATATPVTLASGQSVLFATAFLFSEGAAPGEAGQALWYRAYTP
jgi:hypothetical protein